MRRPKHWIQSKIYGRPDQTDPMEENPFAQYFERTQHYCSGKF